LKPAAITRGNAADMVYVHGACDQAWTAFKIEGYGQALRRRTPDFRALKKSPSL